MQTITSQNKVIAAGLATAVLLAVIAACRFSWVLQEVTNALLIECLGIAVGALLGSLASPGLPGEAERFKGFAKLAAAFATGYVLPHTDTALKVFFSGDGRFWKCGAVFFLTLLFCTAAVAAGLFLYVFRVYTKSSSTMERKNAILKSVEEVKQTLQKLEAEA